jgi:hypothetical protein
MLEQPISPASWTESIKNCSGTAVDRTNQYRFLAWTAVWGIAFVSATWALSRGLVPAGVAAWFVALTPLLPAVMALSAYLRFLRMADELLRKIQFEGLAIGFGCGVIAGVGYPLLERAGAPESPGLVMLVMMLGWAVGQLLGLRRYR